MLFQPTTTTPEQMIQLYLDMLRPRMLEEKMLLLLRQGRVSKWFAGIGQEAIAIGATAALLPNEYICPLHRNLGVFTSRQVPLDRLLQQFQGKADGFSRGRERSFHFGSNEHHIVGMISHLGPQLSVGAGIALGHQLSGEPRVSLALTGEGGTSQGEFHEALNVAAVWDLPVIFLVENNGYGLSTPTTQQYRCAQLADRAAGYGMQGITIDGNNVIEVFETIQRLSAEMRQRPRPVLVEAMTFRMRGHEEASGTKYVPPELISAWAEKDPLRCYEEYLLAQGLLNADAIATHRAGFKREIEEAVELAFAAPTIQSTISNELGDVYAPAEPARPIPAGAERKEMRLIDAIRNGLEVAMDRDPGLVLMGQDIAEYGGVFKATEGFVEKYGPARVRNTPLCESAILGIALGLSVKGYASMVEMQFADFVSCGFNQIVNNLAKIHYRWGQPANVVIRMPTGAGVGAGPFHSQSNEQWFNHVPGLKVVYPSNPTDAKGLLLAALRDPNPVLFFEHKMLYRSIVEEVPEGEYEIPIGQAHLLQEGDDLTIITYGAGVHWARKALNAMPDVSATLLDLRTLLPLDTAAIFAAVRRTGKVLILHEATLTYGPGGELAALIAETCFEDLDAPIKRLASLDTPVPFAAELEGQFLPEKQLTNAIVELMAY